MKDEPRNRSTWERVKMALRLLFSVKALEPVYKEGWEDGRRELYDDYKAMKKTIEPFMKKVCDKAFHGGSAIVIPGMIPTELYRIPFIPTEDMLGAAVIVGDNERPVETIKMKVNTFRQETIQKTFKEDSRFASDICAAYNEASKHLERFLLENGFVKHQIIENGTSPYPTFVFFTNVMGKL